MDNLTHHQHKMLDKLYGPLEKKDPSTELIRVSKLYRLHGVYQEPGYIKERFQVSINSLLHRYLQSKPQFYHLDYFKAHYKMLAGDFIEDNIDANEKDFIDEYINSQQEIIDKTFRHFIPIEGYESLELVQFVDKDFFDDFIRGSKKKIEFLKSLSIVQENTPEINYDNPYPEYFNSYGYKIYEDFTSSMEAEEIVLAEMSFLVNKLKKDGLMNSDKSLINIFNFMVEEFDTNFGKATKFKSNYSSGKRLRLYQEMKKRYNTVP
jgi:hypothetical protein